MKRILIYETDSGEAVHLSQFLQKAGFAVATVTTARQAVGFAREYEFELFIINLSRPGETSFTTVAEVKCRPQSAGVGVIGLVADAAQASAATEAGCDAVVVRPYPEAELLHKVNDLLVVHEEAVAMGPTAHLAGVAPHGVTEVTSPESNQSSSSSGIESEPFGILAESLCRNVEWLEAQNADLGEQGPIAIESMRGAATSLQQRLEPSKISPGDSVPDSVRDRHVRHDFRNLLAAVNGFSEILLLDESIQEDVQSRLMELKRDSREFCNLLDGIRETEAA